MKYTALSGTSSLVVLWLTCSKNYLPQLKIVSLSLYLYICVNYWIVYHECEPKNNNPVDFWHLFYKGDTFCNLHAFNEFIPLWSKFIPCRVLLISKRSKSGLEVIKLLSCSTQLSMIFHLVIKIKIPTIKTFFMLNSAEHAQLSWAWKKF